jgi:hypothetical protein
MKTLSTAAMYGLVPVPPAQDRHAFGNNDDQPAMNDDANAALLAWYRHLATNDDANSSFLRPLGSCATQSRNELVEA